MNFTVLDYLIAISHKFFNKIWERKSIISQRDKIPTLILIGDLWHRSNDPFDRADPKIGHLPEHRKPLIAVTSKNPLVEQACNGKIMSEIDAPKKTRK